MSWTFRGKVSQKRVLPHEAYELAPKHIFYNPSDAVPAWLVQAQCHLAVLSISGSVEILNNYGFGTKHVLQPPSSESGGICWARYDARGKALTVVLGLREELLSRARLALDQSLAALHLELVISTGGGFSLHDQNPYSISPTLERFREGAPVPLDPAASLWLVRGDLE